ncbi:PREDICTED: uncharacterized protein LOC109232505 [Nicotiana attenuata]|uniref:uncharacterized protein LOC109232505 n=1 Tax=Nicotiana attenuata TaxID=49451 RepID=UPI0009054CBC|nr:PREDICTED: uncharacterized protein LOC109232505 [Nicotiana attenuata]
MQDPNFKKGFKFDHVWALMKDFEKFNNGNVERKKTRKQNYAYISSDSEARVPDSPCVSSPNLSFSVNLNEDVAGDSTPSQRPSGVKKAKMKRKINDGFMKIVESQNNRIVEAMNSATERQKETNDIEREKIRLKELKYDCKIMSMDVVLFWIQFVVNICGKNNNIIMYKRSQQPQQSQPQQSSVPFTQYYNNFGVPENDMSHY